MDKSLSVKETVRRCLIRYPSLFRDKGDVYDHLFLVIGNGYQWVDGGLVETFSDDDDDDDDDDDQPQWADESGDGPANETPEITAMMRPGRILDARRQNNQIRFVLDNFDALFDEPLILRHPYPACEYSRLFTMPDDVKDDWRKACDDTSSALFLWIHNQEQGRLAAVKRMKELNISFRRKHFLEADRRLAKILRQVHKED